MSRVGDHARELHADALTWTSSSQRDSGFWWDGPTADGVVIRIPQDPCTMRDEAAVFVDGERVKITGRISRRRDGGSTTIPTSVGVIHVNRRIGSQHSVSLKREDGSPHA